MHGKRVDGWEVDRDDGKCPSRGLRWRHPWADQLPFHQTFVRCEEGSSGWSWPGRQSSSPVAPGASARGSRGRSSRRARTWSCAPADRPARPSNPAAGKPSSARSTCANADAVRAFFAAVAADHGRLDALVNNAGGTPYRLLDEGEAERHARVVELNLTAPLTASLAARPYLRGGARLGRDDRQRERGAALARDGGVRRREGGPGEPRPLDGGGVGARGPRQHPGTRDGPHRTERTALRRRGGRRARWAGPCRSAGSPSPQEVGAAAVFLASRAGVVHQRRVPPRPRGRRTPRVPGRGQRANKPKGTEDERTVRGPGRDRDRRGAGPWPRPRAGVRRAGGAGRGQRPGGAASTGRAASAGPRSPVVDEIRAAGGEAVAHGGDIATTEGAASLDRDGAGRRSARCTPWSTTRGSCATGCWSTSTRTTGTR